MGIDFKCILQKGPVEAEESDYIAVVILCVDLKGHAHLGRREGFVGKDGYTAVYSRVQLGCILKPSFLSPVVIASRKELHTIVECGDSKLLIFCCQSLSDSRNCRNPLVHIR